MQRLPIVRGFAVFALAALAACDATRSTSAAGPAAAAEGVAGQVAALGFRTDMIQDFGDYVLVEEDIMITKAQLRSAAPPRASGPMGPRFQYRTTNLVGSPKVNQITVDLSGLASQPDWQTAAATALTHWSGIGNSYVQMAQGSPADITVGIACTSSNVAAFASFPSSGNPGGTVYVNTCFAYSTTDAQKLHNMVHEFGHTLGFRHSNYTQMGESAGTDGAVLISGTPTSGNASGSVMNGGTALNSWAGFAASDLTAVRTIYPLPVPVLSVSNSGGTPLLSWSALAGAQSYDVTLRVLTRTATAIINDYTVLVGTTSGTSLLDANNAYTGDNTCSWNDFGEQYYQIYRYSLVAHFPNGTTGVTLPAPVAADC